MRSRSRVVSGLAALSLGIGLLGGLVAEPSVAATTTAPTASVAKAGPVARAKITYPTNGQRVSMMVTAKGTASGVKRIWLVVYSQRVHQYYPQNGPTLVVRGRWVSPVYFGTPMLGRGEKYDLLACKTTDGTARIFQQYLAHGRTTGHWIGLQRLPGGCQVLSFRHVVRK